MQENSVKSILKAQNGDKDEMARLVEDNQRLIWNIVKRFLGRGYDKEDIYQIGCMGFIKAIRRFDSNFEVKLSTYAVPYILGEIKRFLRDDGPIKVSRSIKELNIRINELKNEYLVKGIELNLSEISSILKVSKEDIAMAIESGNSVESIEKNIYDNGDFNILDVLSSNIDEATEISDKITIRSLINNLEERDKEIILLRFFKDKTQTEVSKILGISQVQVSRIEKRILNRMKQQLIS